MRGSEWRIGRYCKEEVQTARTNRMELAKVKFGSLDLEELDRLGRKGGRLAVRETYPILIFFSKNISSRKTAVTSGVISEKRRVGGNGERLSPAVVVTLLAFVEIEV